MVIEARTGRLVRTSALGVGRLLSVHDDKALVRYFTAPSNSPYVEREHDCSELAPARLSPHTRVYLREDYGWRIGRIDADGDPDDLGRYLIAFPNLQGDRLTDEAFEVRWRVPIEDPFVILESLGGDGPLVYESRLEFLRHWATQRAAAVGVEGLLLASVELHRHQLAVVRRVSTDPIKRYLLADEVGLGKTIEATALIWRFLDRNPSGRVLILVPEHLRHQWAVELADRFRTPLFAKAFVKIRSLNDEATWPIESVDLLVIDEAHRVSRNGTLSTDARRKVAELAHAADELLLLSATPVRSNEAGFLDLLYLLDPAHYHPEQVDEFTRRVHNRDRLALTCQALVSDIDELDLSLYAEQLKADYPEDCLLADLLDAADSADDEARPLAVTRVRQHLSEAYRLHQRVLRTRRTPEVMASFRIRGRKRAKSFLVRVGDPDTTRRTDLLDRLRIDLMSAVEGGVLEPMESVEMLREAAQRCGSLPHALTALRSTEESAPGDLISQLQALIRSGVVSNLDSSIDAIDGNRDGQVAALVDALTPFTGSKTQSRVVVASTFTETARAVTIEMSRRWGRSRVAAHLRDNGEDQNRAAIERWMAGGPCSILVVDDSAEEGVNLQIANLLIHLDLPWNTFRIEQRIGRCDRHSRGAVGPIESKVVVFGDEPYAMNWLEFADGCEAFTRSLSSLQYVLSDTERQLLTAVIRDGPAAIGDATVEQADKLSEELVRIIAHDALDQVEEETTEDATTVDQLLIDSDRSSGLTRALITWLEGVGTKLDREDRDVIRVRPRPRPQVPFDLETKIVAIAGSPNALTRSRAVSHTLPILRAAHPTVDAVAEHLLQADRGVAFTTFRPWPGMSSPVVLFRADFLVTAAFPEEFIASAEGLGVMPWVDQVLREVSPPLVEKIVLAPTGREATDPRLLEPYSPRRGDQNLSSRPEVFAKLVATLDWTALCLDAAERTRALVDMRASVTDRPLAAAHQIRQSLAQRMDRSRARRMAGMIDTDADLGRLGAMLPQRLESRVEALGCGAMFVGDPGIVGDP
ncbi:protein DpdE [Mycolicibacterium austroafricanum]|uniref:protein DpdE n=1 Tax=Mycolicibacterium austroafricanum TaxID=39687 RepID=UPI000D691DDE|nr:protein DpdE [Mycolicibacterium austroafricanum]QZY47229.1 DEAD/DEAH box helicase [Mycolicibacterium austroafricanum]